MRAGRYALARSGTGASSSNDVDTSRLQSLDACMTARSRQLGNHLTLVVGGPVGVARDRVRETQHHDYDERDNRSDDRDRQEHHDECE